ncbi:hypothetical protein BDZ88DRAFT_418840 [Geranomyces variabilis]|nr:hypothetical protein BDZ88DRAFT_418840 [Geranomyces variabilis]KAJ3140514.1 Lactosylceramide 4-alpha-galactosyltransferase [Geranomyces variabilis]
MGLATGTPENDVLLRVNVGSGDSSSRGSNADQYLAAHDESDSTFYYSDSSGPTSPLPAFRTSRREHKGKRSSSSKSKTAVKPAILYCTIACASVLSVLALLAYTSYTSGALHKIQKTVATKKLMWWDSWFHGRVSPEEIARLPKKCLDYRLSMFHGVVNVITPSESEVSFNPQLQAAKQAGSDNQTVSEVVSAPPTTSIKPAVSIPKSIYFLHFNPNFTAYRYLCSIESAARMNPQHTITVLAKNVSDFARNLEPWRKAVGTTISNRIRIRRIDYTGYFQGTPFEPWWRDGRWRQSHWVSQNLGNALRLAVIYKEGGVYMDMDIISLNPLPTVTRSIAREEKIRINNAALSFPSLDPLLWALMEELVLGWDGFAWANNGPYAVTRMFQRNCQKTCVQLGILPSPETKRSAPAPNAPAPKVVSTPAAPPTASTAALRPGETPAAAEKNKQLPSAVAAAPAGPPSAVAVAPAGMQSTVAAAPAAGNKIDDPLLANLKEDDHPSWNDPNWKDAHEIGDHAAFAAPSDMPAAVGQHPPDLLSLSLPPTDSATAQRLRARYMYEHRRDAAYWLSFGFFYEDFRDRSLLYEAPFCENMSVFHPARFYPVHYTTGAVLADTWDQQCDRLDDIKKQSVGLHWWNKIAGTTALAKESLLAVIMVTQCPGVVEAYGLEALHIV